MQIEVQNKLNCIYLRLYHHVLDYHTNYIQETEKAKKHTRNINSNINQINLTLLLTL